jgi:hypothetical protein
MGSSGSDTFGNYAPSGTTKCDQSVDSDLEDVARHEFYAKRGVVPAPSTAVRLAKGTVAGRLVVEDTATGLAIGSLPTRWHYLLLCQEKGYVYEGEVTASRSGSVPVVEVHLDPV